MPRLARVDASGRYVALADQDRARWDRARLHEGLRALARAVALRRPGEFMLEAAITALQIRGADEGDRPSESPRASASVAPSPLIRSPAAPDLRGSFRTTAATSAQAV